MPKMIVVQSQNFDYYNYYVTCNYVFDEPKPVIENSYTYEENSVLYCATATEKGVYCYTYCRNNPLHYTDPTGNKLKWWQGLLIGLGIDALTGGGISAAGLITGSMAIPTAVATYIPFSNTSYEIQKYISPIALKFNWGIGTEQSSIGFDVSMGMIKGFAPGVRYHAGVTHHFKTYGGYTGREIRQGLEVEATPLISYSMTKFEAGEYSQRTAMITLGGPLFNVSYENDYMFGIPGPDGGDRWRTAAMRMNFGGLSLNLNMFTGDPDVDGNRPTVGIGGWQHYSSSSANDPRLRAGVLSFGFGPFRFGRNSEAIRNAFQNELIHKNMNPPSPLFGVLPIPPSWFFYFGTGSGNTLW